MDEAGSEAKALTEGVAVLKVVFIPIKVRFNRPFAFAIARTGGRPVTIFEGQVLDVTQ